MRVRMSIRDIVDMKELGEWHIVVPLDSSECKYKHVVK